MDAIELRMGEMRRYIITMIDEHSDYVLALAVPSLNSDIVNHFFSRAARLFPVGISQIITDNGKEFLGSFDKTLQEAAIKHLWTYPYTPKMNAICERFNRALREQFIMWWTHTQQTHRPPRLGRYVGWLVQTSGYG